MTRRRSSAAATACWCRSSSTISDGPGGGRSPSSIFPGEPSQAYVKRVVGLPGESIRIVDGDIFVDGQIVRKSLPEIRAMRILVHDSRFQPRDAEPVSALAVSIAAARSGSPRAAGSRAGRPVRPQPLSRRRARPADDWLVYQHWDPARGRYGPVRDFYAYNGGDLRADNEVEDLGMEARLCGRATRSSAISVALRSGSDQFVVTDSGRRSGDRSSSCETTGESADRIAGIRLKNSGLWPRSVTLEAVGLRSAGAGRDRRAAPVRSVRFRRPAVAGPGRARARSRWGCAAGPSRSPSCGSIGTSTTPARWPTRRAIPTGCRRPVQLGDGRILRPGRQQPGLQRFAVLERRPGRDAARCSWASRSWFICPARLSRSRSSGGRCAGFPIRDESVTFGSEAEPRRAGRRPEPSVERPRRSEMTMVDAGSQSSSSPVSSRRGNT